MKHVLLTFFLVAVMANMAAASDSASRPGSPAPDLPAKIGSAMFAFYQVNYHEQLVVITTLQYCEAGELAARMIGGLPDLPSFFRQSNHQQLLHDIVNKEALVNGYEVKNTLEFDSIAAQAMLQGQSYFLGYLKGYRVAMDSFFDRQVMEPLCRAAVDEAGKYIQENTLASRDG
jgi:hypothetical protein